MKIEEIPDEQVLYGECCGEPKSFLLRALRGVVGSAALLFPLLTIAILIHVVLRYVCGINFV